MDTVDQNPMNTAMPIARMGNFEERQKQLPTQLRPIFDKPKPTRSKSFGNPFTKNKKDGFSAEEAFDEATIDENGFVVRRQMAGNKRRLPPKWTSNWRRSKINVPVETRLHASSPDSEVSEQPKSQVNTKRTPTPVQSPYLLQKVQPFLQKAESIIRRPGERIELRSEFKAILEEMKGNIDLEKEFLRKSVVMCAYFKRHFLQAFLLKRLQSHNIRKPPPSEGSFKPIKDSPPIKENGFSKKRPLEKPLEKPKATIQPKLKRVKLETVQKQLPSSQTRLGNLNNLWSMKKEQSPVPNSEHTTAHTDKLIKNGF